MVFPWFLPFSRSLLPVVLPVMNMQPIGGATASARMPVSDKNNLPQPFPSWILKLLFIEAFLNSLCHRHGAPPFFVNGFYYLCIIQACNMPTGTILFPIPSPHVMQGNHG